MNFLVLAMLDIPIHKGNKGHVQALHVIFTLFSAFKNSQHFQLLAAENQGENNNNQPDRLIL